MGTEVLRYLYFKLRREGNETELPAGDMIQLPFNDGLYLLSDLKFGYMGLMNEDFLTEDLIDTTPIDINLDRIDVENDTTGSNDFETIKLYRKVTIDYVDEWGDSQSARLDEGPFEEGESVLLCNKLIRIDSMEYIDDGSYSGDIFVEYSVKDSQDWERFESNGDDDPDEALVFDYLNTSGDEEYIFSAVQNPVNVTFGDKYDELHPKGLNGFWTIQTMADLDDENDWRLWIDKNKDGFWEMAETCNDLTGGLGYIAACYGPTGCESNSTVKTEFKNDVWFCADEANIVIKGTSDSGAEHEIAVGLSKDPANSPPEDQMLVSLGVGNCTRCDLDGCEDISEGDDDGKLISLSGATVNVDWTEVEEPEDTDNKEDIITQVSAVIPEEQLRPTIFFGIESSLNTSEITITDAQEGSEVNIGGVQVTVEEFGVTGSVSGGGVLSEGGETTVECPAQTVSCPDVSVETIDPVSIGYQLVVVENAANSGKNLILIGGPSVNAMTEGLASVEDVCAAPMVKLVSANKLLVAGCEAAETAQAADALKNWLAAL